MSTDSRAAIPLAAGVAVALAVSATAAGAADLGGGRTTAAYAAPERAPSWTGFYFGAGIGYGTGSAFVDGTAGSLSFDQTGSIATVFGGYNWQVGGAVLGLEADIGTGGFGGTSASNHGGLDLGVNALGSLRARAGFLATPSLLLYATGGLAWADLDIKYAGLANESKMLTGYQIGLGAETMLSPNWTLRLEYLYTDLGRETLSVGPISNGYDAEFHTVRAGIAFKF